MFEKLLGKILDEQLGKFFIIKDRDISLGVFKGNIQLENLSLRPTALQAYNLPVVIKHGHVGKVSIKVKWFVLLGGGGGAGREGSGAPLDALKGRERGGGADAARLTRRAPARRRSKLLTDPVNVVVEDLFFVAGPQTQWDESQEALRKLEVQRSKLQADEVVRKLKRDAVSGVTAALKDKAKSMPAIVQKIVENIQVFIKNIHICYEDGFTRPDNPFILGIVLGGLNINNVNVDAAHKGPAWPGMGALPREVATQYAGKYVAKVAELENFAVYWNADQLYFPLSSMPPADLMRFLQYKIDLIRMPSLPESALLDPKNRSRFIVHPIKMTVDVDIMKEGVAGVPHVSARVDILEVQLAVDASQLEGARTLGEFFSKFEQCAPLPSSLF
eukprot:tig00020710_g13346.t1